VRALVRNIESFEQHLGVFAGDEHGVTVTTVGVDRRPGVAEVPVVRNHVDDFEALGVAAAVHGPARFVLLGIGVEDLSWQISIRSHLAHDEVPIARERPAAVESN